MLSLGAYAFSCCLKVKSVVIPESVESIGGYAFNNCSALSSITISNNVKTIGISAFSGCESLLSVEIPSGISVIENELFRNCNNLKSIIIPESIKSIKNSAFLGCSSLKNVTIKSSEIYSYATGINYDNIGALLANATEVRVLKSIDGESNTYLNENYTKFDEEYYNLYKIKYEYKQVGDGYEITKYNGIEHYVSIPETYAGKKVVSIGDRAFEGCEFIYKIDIPSTIKRIGHSSFQGCNLYMIEIPQSVVEMGEFALDGIIELNLVIVNSVQVYNNLNSGYTYFPNVVEIMVKDSIDNGTNKYLASFAHCNNIQVEGYNVYDNYTDESYFKFIEVEGGYEVESYIWNPEKDLSTIAIPRMHNGKPVVSLGESAISGHSRNPKIIIIPSRDRKSVV